MSIDERRRFRRLPTRLPATVRAGALALRCEVRDYCREGMYLAFDGPMTPDAVTALAPSTVVQVEMTGGASREHVVHGRVARCLPAGLGLLVPGMPMSVLETLGAAAREAMRAELERDDAVPIDAEFRDAARERCTALFDAFLKTVLRDFFEQLSDELGRGAEHAADPARRGEFRRAARTLERRRPLATDRFARSVAASIRQLAADAAGRTADETPGRAPEADDDTFDDWLNLSTVAHRVEADQRAQLERLYRRYGRLRDLPVERQTCPFGPDAICQAFRSALQVLEPTPDVRAAAYRIVGLVLSRRCPVLYAQLLAVLAPAPAELVTRIDAGDDAPDADRDETPEVAVGTR